MNGNAVAKEIEKIHMEYTSVIQYNNENLLSSVLSIAYLSSMQYYFKPIREFPAGRGFADFVFIPKPEFQNYYPALVVELKWDKSVRAALETENIRSLLHAMQGSFCWWELTTMKKQKNMNAGLKSMKNKGVCS